MSGIVDQLEVMGHSIKKSAGHAAHDVRHGIGRAARYVDDVEHRRNVHMKYQLQNPRRQRGKVYGKGLH